jgi:hypothetical protein
VTFVKNHESTDALMVKADSDISSAENLSALYPRLTISVPFGGPEIIGATTNDVLSLWVVAIVGLTLHESAYSIL